MKMEFGSWASVKMGGRLDQAAAIKAAKARIALNGIERQPPIAVIVPIPMDPPISSLGPLPVGGRFLGASILPQGAEFPSPGPPRLLDIAKAGRDYFRATQNISGTDLMSHRRRKEFVGPRHVVFWLCSRLTGRSLPDIGRIVGEGRDHTTILHAVRKVQRSIKIHRDRDAIEQASGIIALLESRGFYMPEIPEELGYRARPPGKL